MLATDEGEAERPDDRSRAFADLGLRAELVAAVADLGYEAPTPIQVAAIPPLLAGRDLLGQAATGTGKTAAFALPMLHRLFDAERKTEPSALVLVPTRELAMQVAEAIHRYGRAAGVRVLPIYGGQPIPKQLHAIARGLDVVVATPGRAIDHIQRGTLKLGRISTVVLDEADEMLDMGFAEDLETILESVPPDRQNVLFSATMPRHIRAIAERHLKDPARVSIAVEQPAAGELQRVRQTAYVVPRAHKLETLHRVLDFEAPSRAIVFCRTRTEVDELTQTLAAHGYGAESIHGGMGQDARDRVMRRFKAGTADLLIATDVAARGLDIEDVSHVVNFDVPAAPDAYLHRIGRTGRAGKPGVAITLAEPRERHVLRSIEERTRQKLDIARVPTLAELRARRIEGVAAAIRDVLVAGELEGFRAVAEGLAHQFDLVDVAAAAIKLALPEGDRGDARVADFAASLPPPGLDRPRPDRAAPREGRPAFAQGGRRGGQGPVRGRDAGRFETLWLSVGRNAGVRPGDLVGAIANELGVDASAIGKVDILERCSLVEVERGLADDVLRVLPEATIRGKRLTVRRHLEPQETPDARASPARVAPARRPRPGEPPGRTQRAPSESRGARAGEQRAAARKGAKTKRPS